MNPIDRILSLLAPHSCVVCRREGDVICLDCVDAIPTLSSICYACGKATRSARPCSDHMGRLRPRHVWMYTAYKDNAKVLLGAYKFNEQRAGAVPIAKMMEQLLPYYAEPPLISFVPTASVHRRTRGFDHAELLAKEIAKQRAWNYMRLLRRSGQVRQLGADRATRKRQLKNIFVATDTKLIKGRHIILVDDVITTGATIEACTTVLKKAGAAQVDALVFARTMEKGKPSSKK